jgi:D-alanine--poly(phosphoribitol) ligase subunit 1
MDVSVADLVRASMRKHPERLALHARDEQLTYRELARRIAGVRSRLRELGLDSAPRLGIVTGDDASTYVAIIAAFLSGATYVPLNKKAPLARNLDIVEDADLSAIIAAEPGELTEAAGLPVVTGFQRAVAEPQVDDAVPAVEDAAYLLFTSGSTGKPKGVPIDHGSLNRFMTMMLRECGYTFGPDDRFLQMFELTFDLSVVSLFLPLCVGASCHIVPDSRIGFVAALKVLREQRITVALMVPSLLAYVEAHLETVRLPDLRLSMFCGEALLQPLVEKWSKVVDGRAVHNWYGPTEATIFCMRYEWSEDRSANAAVNGVVPIGRPMGDTEAWLIDANGQRVDAPGEKGELVLAGRQLASGYWRSPARTAEAFFKAPGAERPSGYRTGDLCFKNADGDFVYCGRTDAQVKVDGHRVELGEIEHAVRKVTGRTAVAVVAVPDGRGVVLALFMERPEIDESSLISELKGLLPAYMLPRHIRYLDQLPLNLNGKFDRPKMRALFLEAASV